MVLYVSLLDSSASNPLVFCKCLQIFLLYFINLFEIALYEWVPEVLQLSHMINITNHTNYRKRESKKLMKYYPAEVTLELCIPEF